MGKSEWNKFEENRNELGLIGQKLKAQSQDLLTNAMALEYVIDELEGVLKVLFKVGKGDLDV
jgi:hypothetical protein